MAKPPIDSTEALSRQYVAACWHLGGMQAHLTNLSELWGVDTSAAAAALRQVRTDLDRVWHEVKGA